MDVRKTVLVGHSAEQMFDLIEACEHYPDFLPWCSGATVVARDEATVVADITRQLPAASASISGRAIRNGARRR